MHIATPEIQQRNLTFQQRTDWFSSWIYCPHLGPNPRGSTRLTSSEQLHSFNNFRCPKSHSAATCQTDFRLMAALMVMKNCRTRWPTVNNRTRSSWDQCNKANNDQHFSTSWSITACWMIISFYETLKPMKPSAFKTPLAGCLMIMSTRGSPLCSFQQLQHFLSTLWALRWILFKCFHSSNK